MSESPGSGNWTSLLSWDVQLLPMLAVNMSGKASNAEVSRLAVELPVMVTGAQFMYISRLPTLLNHVHAMVALPAGTESGMVKLYVLGSTALAESVAAFPAMFISGHPPWMEWMTLN